MILLTIQTTVFLLLAIVSWTLILLGKTNENRAKELLKELLTVPPWSTCDDWLDRAFTILAYTSWILIFGLSWLLFTKFIFKD